MKGLSPRLISDCVWMPRNLKEKVRAILVTVYQMLYEMLGELYGLSL